MGGETAFFLLWLGFLGGQSPALTLLLLLVLAFVPALLSAGLRLWRVLSRGSSAFSRVPGVFWRVSSVFWCVLAWFLVRLAGGAVCFRGLAPFGAGWRPSAFILQGAKSC